MIPLRPYQKRTLREYAELVSVGVRRVIIQMPTGAGKTVTGLACCDMAIRRFKPVGLGSLWLAHREELVNQPVQRILADGWPVDNLCVWQAGRPIGNRDADLHVASIQTLIQMSDEDLSSFMMRIGLTVLDESRHYVAKEFSRVAKRAKPSTYLLGLDATPCRPDGTPMRDLFDRIIIGPSVEELVDGGFLVPHVIIAPAEYQDELAQDAVEAYLEHGDHRQGIIFCGAVSHAHDVAARLRDAGVPAAALDAKTDSDERGNAIRDFMAGELGVLCNVRILTEGTDLPPAEVIIHAGKCGSLSDWIQKGGRGLRPCPGTGKMRCKIIDLHGSFHEYGFLDDPHEYSLDGKGVRLADALPPIGQCPKCYAWVRSAALCSQCGRRAPVFVAPPPKVKAADLIEVRRADATDKRQERLARWVLDALRQGHKPARAAFRYQGTYGERPPWEWVNAAEREGRAVLEAEEKKRRAASEPLLGLMGGEE
jgi:superfamily II DNA or RNA helicase